MPSPGVPADGFPSSFLSRHVPEGGSLLPLVVGVTGHRDLRDEDLPLLEEAVREIFREFHRRLPTTPIVLLTPLAEGADRLAARVFLDVFGADPRHRLVALLPMPLTEYRKDFESSGSLQEFDELLHAGDVIQLPLPPHPAPSAWSGSARAVLYERVGATIALHSHIVVALWDGSVTEKKGGTAEVVRFRLEGLPEQYLPDPEPLDPPECGAVIHIQTPRASGPPSPSSPPAAAGVLYPKHWSDPKRAPFLESQLLEQLETFNRDASALLHRQPKRVQTSREWVLPRRSAPELSQAERHILQVYSAADALALHNQGIARRVILSLLVMGVLAVAANVTLADFIQRAELVWAYLTFLFFGMAGLGIANRFDWQQRHINYRALAEALRVQLFWRLSAVPLSAADAYLGGQREELQGIRRALRFSDLLTLAEPRPDPAAATERLHLVRTRWVEDQRRYFLGSDGHGGAVARDRRRVRSISWVTRACLALGVLLIVPLAVGPEALNREWIIARGTGTAQLRDILLAGSALAFASAAAVAGYGHIMGFAEHVRNGNRIGALFLRAEERLQVLLEGPGGETQVADARRVLTGLGREALAENGDWVILHRERPWEFTPA